MLEDHYHITRHPAVVKSLAILLALTPRLVQAQNPFSPDFMLEPYQIESLTQVSYLNSKYSIDSLIFKNTDESRFINYTQGFTIGLPYQFSVGISETYANPIHKNPLNPSEGKSGLKAPFIAVNKLVDYSDTLKFKMSVNLKPNLTGSSDHFNTLQAGILAIAKVKDNLDLSVGYNRTRYELSNTDADIYSLILSRKFSNETLLSLSYDKYKWSETKTTLGNFDASDAYAITADLSSSLAKDIWVSLNASYYYNKCTFTPIFPPIEYTNKTDQYTGGVTIKWLF